MKIFEEEKMRKQLKEMREKYNISVQEIAENINATTKTIENIESGKRKRNDATFYAYMYYIKSMVYEQGFYNINDSFNEKINKLIETQKFIFDTNLEVALENNTRMICAMTDIDLPVIQQFIN
jgi:DNA-binding XRE family transcriptional regulator